MFSSSICISLVNCLVLIIFGCKDAICYLLLMLMLMLPLPLLLIIQSLFRCICSSYFISVGSRAQSYLCKLTKMKSSLNLIFVLLLSVGFNFSYGKYQCINSAFETKQKKERWCVLVAQSCWAPAADTAFSSP